MVQRFSTTKLKQTTIMMTRTMMKSSNTKPLWRVRQTDLLSLKLVCYLPLLPWWHLQIMRITHLFLFPLFTSLKNTTELASGWHRWHMYYEKEKKNQNKVHCKVRKRKKNYLLHFFLIIRYILLPQFSKNVQNICLRLTETGVWEVPWITKNEFQLCCVLKAIT